MEPKKVGRALGIGVRLASRMVQQRVAEAAHAQPSQNAAELTTYRASAAQNAGPAPGVRGARPGSRENLAQSGWRAQVKRGLRAFFEAFLGPFTHAGGILWLEITGTFFALFALFFVQGIYRARGAWRGGPEQLHLLLYVALAAGFAWFSASSFLRAHRKSKRGQVSR